MKAAEPAKYERILGPLDALENRVPVTAKAEGAACLLPGRQETVALDEEPVIRPERGLSQDRGPARGQLHCSLRFRR